MQLQEFYDYKNQLMQDLLTDEEITTLIDPNNTVTDPSDLAYSQVFPYEYLPDTVDHGKTFVCFDVDIQEASANRTFLSPTLYIWVFTHKSRMRLPEGGVRIDKLCTKICENINGSLNYGLGELKLYAVKRFAPMTDFNGKLITFHAKDFNKIYDPQKRIPANRKTG